MDILLVEDNKDLINFLKKALIVEGYKVISESDGQKALGLILSKRFDLIILDLMLPGMSGEQIMKEVRKHEIDTPVIILTAVRKTDSRVKLLDLGADDYLCKPFSLVELTARMRNILRRAGKIKESPKIIQYGDLSIDTSKCRAERGGKEIRLNPKEYALLLYIISRPNQILSREDLLRNVWDYNTNFFSNTVDAHMATVRKKLNTKNSKALIRTIYGKGYMFEIND